MPIYQSEQPRHKLLTLVALTGWGRAEDRSQSKEAGFDAHLVKPVDLAALTKLLAESGGSQQNAEAEHARFVGPSTVFSRRMQRQGYDRGFFSIGQGIAAVALLGAFLVCVQTYFDRSQRPFLEKVASIIGLLGRTSAERRLSDETLAKRVDGGLLPRSVAKAVERNDLVTIREALDAGLDINARDHTIGMTLLHHAADKKNLELVTLLIERGANVNAKDKDHSTPLHFAAYKKGNIEILTYLLRHGAVRDLVDDERLTPLGYAKLAGDAEMIDALGGTSGTTRANPYRKVP